jgi:uncharacterized protein (DUF342 family)
MAFFGSKKTTASETKSIKKVRPVVVRTEHIASEIFKVAKSYEIEPETLDFNLFDVQSYTRLLPDENATNVEWEEISPDKLRELDTETQLLNPNFQIKQVYEVEIYLKEFDPANPCNNFKTAVGANASKSKVYLSVLAGSKLNSYANFAHDFEEMLNKKKIRAGILVYIFDEMVEPLISKLAAQLEVAEELSFVKNETYLIAEGYEPTPTINDALVLHYETNHEIDEKIKVDYAARGFIQSVKEGELLIEYIKPKLGKPGRNCRGEYIKPEEPVVRHEPTFSIDEETIRVSEDAESIKYYAKENGYIAFENNTYVIKREVDVDEISFKTTGSIESGVDSDVNISVTEADAIKDAVGPGMHVEVTEIDIDGNVGSNAKVIAKKATIGGQTHKTAMVRADEVSIHVHKGKAYGKKIHIERLEHGEVDGDEVFVSEAIGGRIRGQEVDVNICASHVQITASRKIVIEKLIGSENTFTIDPLLKKDDRLGKQEHEAQIKAIEAELKDVKSEIKKYKIAVKEGMPAFLEIKKRLVHYKKNGVKMPESFVKKYKQFQNMQQKLKELIAQSEVLQDKLNLLTTRTASFQDNIFDARIINRDKWKGYNEIKFKLVDPPMELVYKPMENSEEHVFGLVQLDDDEYAIRPMSEE